VGQDAGRLKSRGWRRAFTLRLHPDFRVDATFGGALAWLAVCCGGVGRAGLVGGQCGNKKAR
jgi:hypothetical protein